MTYKRGKERATGRTACFVHPVNRVPLYLGSEGSTKVSNRDHMSTVVLVGINRPTIETNHLNTRTHDVRGEKTPLESRVGGRCNLVVCEHLLVEIGEEGVYIHAVAMKLEKFVLLHALELVAKLFLDSRCIGIGMDRKLCDARFKLLIADCDVDINRRRGRNGSGNQSGRIRVSHATVLLHAADLVDKLPSPESHVRASGPGPESKPLEMALVSIVGHDEAKLVQACLAREMIHWDDAVFEMLGQEGIDWEIVDDGLALSPIGRQLPLAT